MSGRPILLFAVLIVSLTGANCNGGGDSGRGRVSHLDCPDPDINRDNWVNIMDQRAEAVRETFGMELQDRANETHDCQQMFVKEIFGSRYGSLLTLWRFKTPTTQQYEDGVVVGGVIRNGPDGYDDLGINKDNLCIYLKGKENQSGKWEATTFAPRDKTCKIEDATATGSKPLNVWRVKQRLPAPDAPYPNVIRWIDTKQRYYIALQCGAQHWCVLGVKTQGSRPDDYLAPIDGWGDEQRLARKKGSGVAPSDLWATITPVGDLAKLSASPDAFLNNPTVVVQIDFRWTDDDDLEDYEGKLGLDKDELMNGVSISLWKNNIGEWWVGYNYPNGAQRKVDRGGQHLGEKGTTRFWWLPQDEGTWFFCPLGCCGDDGKA